MIVTIRMFFLRIHFEEKIRQLLVIIPDLGTQGKFVGPVKHLLFLKNFFEIQLHDKTKIISVRRLISDSNLPFLLFTGFPFSFFLH